MHYYIFLLLKEKNFMDQKQKELIQILVSKGKEILEQPRKRIQYANNPKADDLLDDIENYPHAFVLACVVDRQIKAEKVWIIPYEISKEIGGFEFSKLLNLKLEEIKDIFKRKNLHRFNNQMSEYFYLAIQKIHNDYNDDASNIWKTKPESSTVIKRFLEFKGVGIKIANMAVNKLVRDYKIPLKDYRAIDISPDVHVIRVFKRLGFIPKDERNINVLIHRARDLYPEYPGIFDRPCWEIGRNWCRPENPLCLMCYLNDFCPKIL